MWWHRVGQKIVRNKFTMYKTTNLKLLEIKKIYTIREVFKDSYENVGFRLLEVVNLPFKTTDYGVIERYYNAIYFSPVKETSIEQFNHLLNPSPEDIKKYKEEFEERELEIII